MENKPEINKKKDNSTQLKKYTNISKKQGHDGENNRTSTYGSKTKNKNYNNTKKK